MIYQAFLDEEMKQPHSTGLYVKLGTRANLPRFRRATAELYGVK